jgi:hypothetical protein
MELAVSLSEKMPEVRISRGSKSPAVDVYKDHNSKIRNEVDYIKEKKDSPKYPRYSLSVVKVVHGEGRKSS